ncbi:MAG: MarR family transcriptional regulator [Desulfobulbaceae bacterium]|nr:MarR family transcriptional regulator [Desulfobulbaceae bacterium]
MKSLTEKQGQYLAFIATYIKLNNMSPAESDIQKYFKVTPPTAHQMVVKLESIGAIRRKPRVARSIEVKIDPSEIPSLK